MFDSRRRQAVLLLLLPAVTAVSLAGCGSLASHTAAASPAATTRTLASRFNAARLRGALLTRVNGVTAKTPAASGSYSSIARTIAGEGSAGTRVTPAACGQSVPTGLNSAVLAGSLGASVAFQVGGDDVREILLALPGTVGPSALRGQFAARCAHFTATAKGKTTRYTVKEAAISGIGQQALVVSVRSSGGATESQWSLSYRGAGFAGSVTVTGPSASETAVRELGGQAYAHAVKSLG